LYFSTDSTITTGDTFLGYVSITATAVDASKNFSKAVKIPAGLSAGTYYLGAIADYRNAAVEMDETNNSASTAFTTYDPTPDLTVTAVSASPVTVAQRGTLTLKGTVTNIGTAKTGKTTYAGFYLTDGVSDIFLKQLSVPGTLAAGASKALSTTYRLPVGFPAGTYSVKLIADHTSVLSEIDETNNNLAGNTLTVLP
jgi:subtilase family serine protease